MQERRGATRSIKLVVRALRLSAYEESIFLRHREQKEDGINHPHHALIIVLSAA